MIYNNILRKNENGATAVYAAVVLAVLLMFAALAVDVNYLYGVRNELHNAADAGALAGASVLFDSDGNLTPETRTAAITEATRIGEINKTGNQAVDVTTVETGHWSFTNKLFTAMENTTQLVGWEGMLSSDLDTNDAFINAVRVRTGRGDTPSFFAKILGFADFSVNAGAVAYRGFAGTFSEGEFDQPIAICKESITDPDGSYAECNMGRMLNSGVDTATHNTGGWTNFSQPCETATPVDMEPLICNAGNTEDVQFGQGIGATGGVVDVTFEQLYGCWGTVTGKTTSWNLTLPVIECPGNNVENCAKLVGAVNINVVWMVNKENKIDDDAPRNMTAPGYDDWHCSNQTVGEAGLQCWTEFVEHFNIENVDGPPILPEDFEEMYQKKNIIFLPDCEVHEPTGGNGGENFGIFARIPVLVE